MDVTLLVSGVFALIAVGLLAYLVILWLQFQQDASGMEVREAQLHYQCEANLQASEQARAKTALALEQCRELEKDLSGLRQQLAQLRETGNGKKE